MVTSPVSSPAAILSYGLGVDSTAILLRWLLEPEMRPFDLEALLVITAMTGNEWPITGALVVKYILPLLRKHHVRYVQVARATASQRDGIAILSDSRAPTKLFLGGKYTLFEEMIASGTMPPVATERRCSQKSKGWVLDQFIGRVTDGRPFAHAVGFEANEPGRAERDAREGAKKPALRGRVGWYPLIQWGWDRAACERYIYDKLGVHWPKSACFGCPFALSSAPKRKEIALRWAKEPDLGLTALLMEHVALALNPKQRGLGGKHPAWRDVELHAPKLFALWEEKLWAEPNAVYEVSRVFYPTKKEGQSNAVRKVVRAKAGERGDMLALLAQVGDVEIDPSDGIARVWLRRRTGAAHDSEQFVVVAPAVVEDKTGPGFDEKWAGVPKRRLAMSAAR